MKVAAASRLMRRVASDFDMVRRYAEGFYD
jgi:hypothetical protein